MFDRFDGATRQVLQYAQEEATRFNHNYIGTEHILLGLLRVDEGVAARTLSSLGVQLQDVRNNVEWVIGRDDRTVAGDIGLTPRAKKVIELTVDEAHRLGHHFVGTEHLLLGLAREGEGIASGILESLGVSNDRVRSGVIEVLSKPLARLEEASQQARPPHSRFTQDSLDEAELAAAWLQHAVVDVEHVLLGVLRVRSSLASTAFARAGVTFERCFAQVVSTRGYGRQPVSGAAIYSQSVQESLARAGELARGGNSTQTGTGHLLLAILDSAPVVQVLPDRSALRLDVEERLKHSDED